VRVFLATTNLDAISAVPNARRNRSRIYWVGKKSVCRSSGDSIGGQAMVCQIGCKFKSIFQLLTSGLLPENPKKSMYRARENCQRHETCLGKVPGILAANAPLLSNFLGHSS